MKTFLKIVSVIIVILFLASNLEAKNKTRDSFMNLYLKSYDYYQKDSFELAIKYSTEAINSKKNSNCIACYLDRATSNYVLNNFKEAKADFEYIKKKDSKHSYLLNITKCKLRLGFINIANEEFKIISIKSEDTYVRAQSFAYLKIRDSVYAYIKMIDSISIKENKNKQDSVTKNINIPLKKFILYNILNEKELALEYLELALKDNYKHFRYLEICDDFYELRKDERFNTLVKKYKQLQQSNKS
jgi:tetratricopeptide (TPR) repeat protein